jgi:hypothetical protein
MVIRMLRKITKIPAASTMPARTRRALWTIATLDVMACAWMLAAGDWLDRSSRIGSVITLGGHHLLVFWPALAGFALLAALAPATHGFTMTNRIQLTLMAVAGVLSVVALAGVLSVTLLIVGSLLLVALLGRMLLR